MRIVYLTRGLPFGDGETFIIPEVNALLDAGHEVMVVPRHSHEAVVHNDVDALLARTRPQPKRAKIGLEAARAFARRPGTIARAMWPVRRSRPRYRIVLNAVASAEGTWLARIAREWRADHIHAHWAHWTATVAMAASRVTGIPWSFTAHRYDVVANNLLDEKLRSARFGRFIARYMLEMARGLVSSEAASRAIVLHMGVRVPRELLAPPPRATPVVVCPGRLVPMKGQLYLVDAAAILAARGVPFEIWLAGDGPDAEALAGRIRDRGLTERVKFLGLVPHASLLDLYRTGAVDCVALPSVDLGGGVHEGLSVAVIEAMAHAIPAVSTPTGGQSELLAGAGCEVPQRDPVALADALAVLLTSPDARRRLGAAGRRRIEEDFDVELVAAELVRRFAGAQPPETQARATASGPGRGARP